MSLLRNKILAFIFENSYDGISFEEVENNFPYRPGAVKIEFEDLNKTGEIYLASTDPTPIYRSTLWSENTQDTPCPYCGSNVHSICGDDDE